ncbi:MAG: DedA family protein [Parachlamydiaceae bacterium]|nr:DedA family protein [Parachlamydiaceae bacterium]
MTTPNDLANPVTCSRWALHRRLYDWVLGLAHCRYATIALFCISFAESSFFPVAPDVLQIALTLERRDRAWYYAAVNAVASVLGGILGYMIGMALWHMASGFFFHYIFTEQTFVKVAGLYNAWDFWAVFVAAFTPIPYKVFTIAAGVFHISFPMFLLASVVGRSARFFLVAALLWKYGEPIKQFIETKFNLLTVLLIALLACGFIVLKFL